MGRPVKESVPSTAKQALVELRRMQARLDEAERERTESIAICGMGMRFPGGAHDADSFWQLLSEGVDAITEIPASRWDVDEFYDPDPAAPGKMYTRHGGFIDNVEDFDAEFFGLSPREATCTDPQQRMLLEITWEALENAAIAPSSLARTRSGVFIGMGNSDYGRMLIEQLDGVDAHTGTGGAICVSAGRLSYALGLRGPSLVVDTACSSSLVAVALACESLRRRECNLALAGGSNLILTPEYNIAFSKARMLAADGRCKTFDARADGYVRGEGCGIVVLKRLSDALENDDPILAVIRGFAVNQDGASSGLTVPNGPAQEAVVREALRSGKITAQEVDYVEAHGTATALGDPIEVHALGAVFADRSEDDPLLIGSVKTNFGHLEAAAGIAGLIKVVLALQHEQIPATLHFEQPSPQIDWSRCPVGVATELTDWSHKNGDRLAGVSSFGFSGTNAHVVVGQAPPREYPKPASAKGPAILTLSTKTRSALRELAVRYAERIGTGDASLEEIAWSANTGRSHLSHRLAIVADDEAWVREKLSEFAASGSAEGIRTGEWYDSNPPQVGYLFTGDGSQYPGMGREYYEHHPVFREALDECDRLLAAEISGSLTERLYGSRPGADWSEPASFAQPALFSLQYALARLWESWGAEPSAVLGHGLGEYAAACAAGVFSLESGIALTAARGRLFESADSASLASVAADADAVRSAISDQSPDLFVAAENGPQATIVAGTAEAIDRLAKRMSDVGVDTRMLGSASLLPPTDGVERERLERVAADTDYRTPSVPVFSGRFGRFVDRELCDASAWVPQPRQAVQFSAGMQGLRDEGLRIFLEIGPHPVLVSLARQAMPDDRLTWLATAHRGQSDSVVALDSLAELFVQGVDPDWERLGARHPRRRLALPNYPFEREKFWYSAQPRDSARLPAPERWTTIVSAGRQQADQVPIDMDIGSYAGKWRCLEELTLAYVVEAFRSLKLFATPGESHTADSLVEAGGIKPVYRMLMSRWLDYLAEAGRLERNDGHYVCNEPLADPSVALLLPAVTETLDDIPELLDYVRRCGAMLVDVLLDRESALQTLFPGGANDTARFLYRDWAVPRYFNTIAAAVVDRFVNSLPAGRRARLVEIGAGTGATTASVLPRLAAPNVSYFFTDVSDYFLSQASESFGDYPFVRYGLLDIGKTPESQGYGSHSFDVVVAANVLHATSNLDDTIDHVLSLLAPGGILVLVETTNAPAWSDVTVSLIEGWQSFSDSLRTDSPLLSATQWSQLLRDRGFDDVVALPGEDSPADILGSHVIIAHVAADRSLTEAAADESTIVSFEADSGQVVEAAPAVAVDPEQVAALRQALDEAPPNERADLLVDYVRGGVNRVLRRDPDKPLDRRQRLMDLGVDSLMAVELRNVLTLGLGLEEPLPATLIFDYPTIEAVAEYLDRLVEGGHEADSSADTAASQPDAAAMSADDVDALSDEEVKAALRARIGEG